MQIQDSIFIWWNHWRIPVSPLNMLPFYMNFHLGNIKNCIASIPLRFDHHRPSATLGTIYIHSLQPMLHFSSTTYQAPLVSHLDYFFSVTLIYLSLVFIRYWNKILPSSARGDNILTIHSIRSSYPFPPTKAYTFTIFLPIV